MNKILPLLLIGFFFIACKEPMKSEKVTFNAELAQELKEMAELDQIAAYIPVGEYKDLSETEWQAFKDSVFTMHQKRVQEIFEKHGFVGFDLAGKKGSSDFWVMVQHSDHNPEFQQAVLDKMKVEVEKGNAEPYNYGLLVDRVKLNTGQKQIYGTQVTYYPETGQAHPKILADSLSVNERRKSLGMEPIEEHLNSMTESHFLMNKAHFLEQGITEPTFYPVEKKD